MTTLTNDNVIKEATKLLNKLKDKARKNPKIFGENYGEKEIREFEDKITGSDVSYQNRGKAIDILFEINDFSPLE